MPCVYILLSLSRRVCYKGSTREDTPDSRLKAHNLGKVRWTKSGIPWQLMHSEYFEDYSEARRRELFLKSGLGRQWIKDKFKNIWRGTQVVSRPRRVRLWRKGGTNKLKNIWRGTQVV